MGGERNKANRIDFLFVLCITVFSQCRQQEDDLGCTQGGREDVGGGREEGRWEGRERGGQGQLGEALRWSEKRGRDIPLMMLRVLAELWRSPAGVEPLRLVALMQGLLGWLLGVSQVRRRAERGKTWWFGCVDVGVWFWSASSRLFWWASSKRTREE